LESLLIELDRLSVVALGGGNLSQRTQCRSFAAPVSEQSPIFEGQGQPIERGLVVAQCPRQVAGFL
jgi:hypothetical protein